MNVIEALSVVELIEVNWQRSTLTDETKAMWAASIVEREPHSTLSDGYDAIRDLAAHQAFPPALVEVLLGIRGARLNRVGRESRPALVEPRNGAVSFAQFLHDRPDMAARVKAIADTGKADAITDALAGFIQGRHP